MRAPALLLGLCLAACSASRATPPRAPDLNAPPPSHQIAPGLSVRQIEPGVLVVTRDHPWASNSLVVEMADGSLVLVDTPYTPQATFSLLTWLDGHFGPRKTIAINTHYHLDRAGGNGALRVRGIPTYASDHTARMLAEKGKAHLEEAIGWMKSPADQEEFRKLNLVHPDHTFPEAQGLKLTFGKDSLDVFYPGRGHTEDNVVVYFPTRQLLFAGCLVTSHDKLGNLTEADLNAWPSTLDRLLPRFQARTVVPGHGEPGSPRMVGKMRKLLVEAQSRKDR